MHFRPIGLKVSNDVKVKEENIGKIEEVMLDAEHGKIAYVVISFDGLLGKKDMLFVVPWEPLNIFVAIILEISVLVSNLSPVS